MAKQVDFSKPRKLIDPVFRSALRQHKPSEWVALGFCRRPDGSKHPQYYVSLQDLVRWGAGLTEMRRRGYDAEAAESYLLSVYQRQVPYIREFFTDVQEGQLDKRLRDYCRTSFPEVWPFGR
jgi:hypothetical protein